MFKLSYRVPALAFAAALSSVPYASAQTTDAAPGSGLVYVETNNSAPGANAIVALRRAANGSLSEVPGSPFYTGGTGVRDLTFALSPFANDTPVIANPEHTLLFAVNEGSNTIAVMQIARDGRLTPVAGSPFPSRGFQPVSLSLTGNILAVVNKNSDPAQATAEANAQPNYTTFRVRPDGALRPVTGSVVDATPSPSQALAVPRSRYDRFRAFGYGEKDGYQAYVFGADFAGGNLQSFEVGRNGRLFQNPVTPLPTAPFVGRTFGGGPAPAFPLGLAVNPNFPVLYVGFVTINEVGVYVFGPDGKLYFLNTITDPAAGADCWIITNRAGTRMYVVGTAGNTVTTFDIGTNPLRPAALSVTHLDESATGRSFELALSADERYLYVVGQVDTADAPLTDDTLHVLRVAGNGSTLTEVETGALPSYESNLPTGTRWQGVVAF